MFPLGPLEGLHSIINKGGGSMRRWWAVAVAVLLMALLPVEALASDSSYTTNMIGTHPIHYWKFVNPGGGSGAVPDRGDTGDESHDISSCSGGGALVGPGAAPDGIDSVDGDGGYVSYGATGVCGWQVSTTAQSVAMVGFWINVGAGGLSCEDWLVDDVTAGHMIVRRGCDTGATNVWFWLWMGGQTGWAGVDGGPITVGSWHALVLYVDASNLYIYVDGVRHGPVARTGCGPCSDRMPLSYLDFKHTTQGSLWSEVATWAPLVADSGPADIVATFGTGVVPPPDLLGNGGASIAPIPSGITPITLETCAAITWTDPSTYFPGLFCSFRNAIREVVNVLITVANYFLGLIAWLFDFSKPIDYGPLRALGDTARTRFPFSIPFDVGGILVSVFTATPTAPVFTLHMVAGGTNYAIPIDPGTQFDGVLVLVRWGELIALVVGLGLRFREWSGGGW